MTRAPAAGLARVDRGEQVVDALLAEAVDPQVVASLAQAVEIAAVLHEAALHQQIRDRFAEAVDVHRAAADEVFEQAEALRRALAVRAAVRRLALGARDGRAADGARLRHVKALLFARALAEHGPDHLRDDVAGALDDDGVADAHVLQVDNVFVVQRRELHRRAADHHGLEHRERVERAGAADVHVDPEELRRRLRRRELVGDGPARLAADGAHLPLHRQVVDLDDDAVDLVVERVALLDPALRERGDLIERLEALDVGVDAEAERLQPLQHVPVRRRVAAVVLPAELVPERRAGARR